MQDQYSMKGNLALRGGFSGGAELDSVGGQNFVAQTYTVLSPKREGTVLY
jgi:hypothetical protein